MFLSFKKANIENNQLDKKNAWQRTRIPTILTMHTSIANDADAPPTPPPPDEEAQEGEKDNGGEGCEGQCSWARGGDQGGIR